jgi:hypothetical protein
MEFAAGLFLQGSMEMLEKAGCKDIESRDTKQRPSWISMKWVACVWEKTLPPRYATNGTRCTIAKMCSPRMACTGIS